MALRNTCGRKQPAPLRGLRARPFAGAGQGVASCLTSCPVFGDTASVSPHEGPGLASRLTERRKPQHRTGSAAFPFVPPISAARWEGRKARRFKGSARSPVRQSCRAATLIGVRVVVVATTDLEPIMAASPYQSAHLRLVSAHADSFPKPNAPRDCESELLIRIEQDWFVHYEGTATQLADEGLIPQGLVWPPGAADKRWQANGYSYWLQRSRPKGHKGPKRSWLELDNWVFRVYYTAHDEEWHAQRALQRQTEDLLAAVHRRTREGQLKFHAALALYSSAVSDPAYRLFRQCIPALVQVRRGRKAKSQATQGEQA
jgi:hypothetical protein